MIESGLMIKIEDALSSLFSGMYPLKEDGVDQPGAIYRLRMKPRTPPRPLAPRRWVPSWP